MQWRLLEIIWPTYADMSLTLRPTLFQSRNQALVMNTLALVRFQQNSLMLTYYSDADKDVDLQAAAEMGVIAKRGIVSGGPIYGDAQAVWCGAFLERGVDPVPAIDELTMMRVVCGVANQVSEHWKVPMRYRPFNDGEIWDASQLLWRKVLAAGTTGVEKTIQISFFLQVKTPQTDVMEKLIIPPPEKFQDKVVKTIGQRVSSLEDAVGRSLVYDEIREVLVKSFEKTFGVQFYTEGLTTAEERMVQEAREKYDNEAWLYQRSERKFGPLKSGMLKGEAVCKVPGGPLLRVTVVKKGDVLHDVLFTGSLHASPVDALVKLEGVLQGIPAAGNELEDKIASFYATGISTPGITPAILASTIRRALDQAV